MNTSSVGSKTPFPDNIYPGKIIPNVQPTILDEAEIVVSGDRQDVYGSPLKDFTAIAKMWQAYWAKKDYKLFTPHDVANFMIMVKIARLANSPNHRDSKVDIAGYARCMEILEGEIQAQGVEA